MAFKFQFNADQVHQKAAISAIVDLFEGQPTSEVSGTVFTDIFPNLHPDDYLYDDYLQEELRGIQIRHNQQFPEAFIKVTSLEIDSGTMLEGVSNDSHACPHFTIEMETGTGKTYVYLRTMLELYERYKYSKFIVVVPSVAILEGVKKAVQTMRDHFFTLYSLQLKEWEYESERMGVLRTFAGHQGPALLIMTQQSFNTAARNIYKPSEKLQGERLPYQWLQECRPIVILDEPQNMGSVKSQEAIRTLKPLCVLRYSATHREGQIPNLVYRLTPLEAYRQGLVKQIEVIGVTQLHDISVPMLRLEEVKRGKPITADIVALTMVKGQVSNQRHTLKKDDVLFNKTHVPEHQPLGKVVNIKVAKDDQPAELEFQDGTVISTSDTILGSRLDVWRAQIHQTVKTHLDRQKKLRQEGIKVLSLFFIDRVKNYHPSGSVLRMMFEEAFEALKHRDPAMEHLTAEQVHRGYFAETKSKSGQVTALDDVKADSKEAQQAFDLIMRAKERLLSFEEPVSFIFAHSALREGWDNPNVFQICTLNETTSTIRKRQEIGRGLRLCVNQEGERPDGPNLNVLTVIANESYESFVERLQAEYVEDGEAAPPKPTKAERSSVKRRDDLFNHSAFRTFWQNLSRKLQYHIKIDTDLLVGQTVQRLNQAKFPEQKIGVTHGAYVRVEYTLRLKNVIGDQAWIVRERRDSRGQHNLLVSELDRTIAVSVGGDLFKVTKENELRNFKVSTIEQKYGEWRLTFANGQTLSESEALRFDVQVYDGKVVNHQDEDLQKETYPITDFIGRTVQATGLTRATVTRMFLEMDEKPKLKLLEAPENWGNEFLKVVSEALADHIAERIEYTPRESQTVDLEKLFPLTVDQPQTELIEGGSKSLYDRVQKDSDVEEKFVTQTLMDDQQNIVVYFKFPPKFKIGLPRIIGNYNPDWGILRMDRGQEPVMQLIRETKGNEDISKLRFSSEARKIVAARKYFQSLGIDYRIVTGDTAKYWESQDVTVSRDDLGRLKLQLQ